MPKILEYKITTAVIVILMGWLGLLSFGTYRANQQAHKTLADIESKIKAIKLENEQMEKEREQYKTVSYLDKQARIKLNYKFPDENVVYVYPAEKASGGNNKPVGDFGLNSVWRYVSSLFGKIF